MTTLILTILVKDEIDIIRDMIEYHLFQGVSHIILTDNASEDGTREVAEEFRRRGVLTLIDEPGDNFLQAQWVTRMARLAATEFKADWVINSDADEFWWPEQDSLSRVFSRLPPHVGGGKVRRINFLPSLSQEGHFLARMLTRELESLDPLGCFPLPPKMVHRGDPDINVQSGNHTASGPAIGDIVFLQGLQVFHFPVRSQAQFFRKIRTMGVALERNKTLSEGESHARRYLYEQLKQGRLQVYWDGLSKSDGGGQPGLVEDTRLLQYLTKRRQNG